MLDVLDALASVAGVGVVLSARPEVLEARSALAARPSDLRLRLAPLDDACAGALAQAIVPDLTAADRERLVRTAEGSPLVIGQLARHLAEGGRTESLPLGLEAVLQARVENLSPEERAVAERAAIMGREFWDTVIAELEPKASSPAAALASLTRREFIAWGRADGARAVSAPTLSRVFARLRSRTALRMRCCATRSTGRFRSSGVPSCTSGWRICSKSVRRPTNCSRSTSNRQRNCAPSYARMPHALWLPGLPSASNAQVSARCSGRTAMPPARCSRARRYCSTTRRSAIGSRGASRRSTAQAATSSCPGIFSPATVCWGLPAEVAWGFVYSAEDVGVGRRVALKLIAPTLAADPRFRERFARESRIAAHLEHPNVVPSTQRVRSRGSSSSPCAMSREPISRRSSGAERSITREALRSSPRWRRRSTRRTPAASSTAT